MPRLAAIQISLNRRLRQLRLVMNNPVADQAYGPPVADQAYGNGNNPGSEESNGPISMYAGSHPHNSDISSIISRIFATMYW
ncbi:MAG: hypothetical protein WA323_05920 [Candidatus Nitrosopolaris sp.]